MIRVMALCGVLLLAGCGSNGGDSGGGSELDAATIGKQLGCDTALKLDRDSMAQEERYCKVGPERVAIIRTPDLDTAKAYVDMGSGLGANYALVSDNWLVASNSRSLMQRLADENDWKMF